MARKRTASSTSAKPNRPVVTAITVHVAYPDGTSRVVTYDPRSTEALFWTDWAISEILARYYERHSPKMTREELVRRFGEARVGRVAGKAAEVVITPELIRGLWDTPDDSGVLLGLIRKDGTTIPGA